MRSKPFILFLEFEKPNGEIFTYGWKSYNTSEAAIQAFKDVNNNRCIFKECKLLPVAKIKGCGFMSIISIDK
jgi:hypothetical protein